MKRRIWLYALTCILFAGITAGAVVAFLYGQTVIGTVACVCALLCILCLAAEILQDNFFDKCEKLFAARKFDEERAVLDKVQRNRILFPFVRTGFYLHAVKNAVARDELTLAKAYVDRLRHGGDAGLKYRTAYVKILILLDENEVSQARAEYEDFRIHNEHYAIYQTQLEILDALFSRLAHGDKPLPETAVESCFPVVKRILGRHFEERAAANAAWGE